VPHLVSVDGVKKIVNGEITMGFFNLPTVIDEIKTGKLKALAVTSMTRSPHLPGVPTLDASGLRGYDLVTWFGFGAPAGTPPEIVQRLRDEFAHAAAEPSVKARLRQAGLDPIDQMQPADFAKLIAADLAKWTPIRRQRRVRIAANARLRSGGERDKRMPGTRPGMTGSR
jgi:tripartite-type tricarboxylate transporter receptor subunit TctC